VLFDLDGTLLNTIKDIATAVNFALLKSGYPTHEVEEFKYFVGNGTDIMLKRALPEGRKGKEYIEKIKTIYVEYYDRHSDVFTAAYDGIPELLKSLKEKGVKLGVTSNKIDCMVGLVIKNYFPDCFDVIIGQGDDIPPKPDPAMVISAMDLLGVSADECLYVGDSGVDALTGKNANIFTIGVKWGFRTEKELLENGADAVISHPIELLSYIK
jgi:phosphoglycolate phosphatase